MSDFRTKSTGSMIADALTDTTSLIRDEMDLARTEVNDNLKRAGVAIGLLLGAVVIVLIALNVLVGALVAALVELGLEPGWAALIVGGVLAIIAFAMTAKGLNDLKLSSIAPSRAARSIKRDAQAVKEAYNE